MPAGNFVHFVLYFLRLPVNGNRYSQRYQRIAAVLRRFRTAFALMLSSVLIGTVGYVLIEGYPWLDAYYMAVITLGSVGFGEVHPLSTTGRIFTTFLILFNVGLFAYAISTITGMLAEGGFNKLLNEFRMSLGIENLHKHTIICGYGRHGSEVALELTKQNIPFVVVESQAERLDYLRRETSHLFVEGDATQDEVLAEAGIKRAAALVITLPHDADNLFITLSARQVNAHLRIISRANGGSDEAKIRRAGADQTVVPERIGGFYMATLVSTPDAVDFFNLLSNLGPSKVVFEEIPVYQLQPDFQNQTIAASPLAQSPAVAIVAVRYPAGHYELNPPPAFILKPELHVVLFGTVEQMAAFRQKEVRKV